MKRRLAYSVIIGFILLVLSLMHKVGSLEPMPYLNGGCGNGGICGVAAVPPGGFTAPTSLAKRGFPLPAVSLSADDDSPNNYYKSLDTINLLVDFAIYTVLALVLLTILARINKPSKH